MVRPLPPPPLWQILDPPLTVTDLCYHSFTLCHLCYNSHKSKLTTLDCIVFRNGKIKWEPKKPWIRYRCIKNRQFRIFSQILVEFGSLWICMARLTSNHICPCLERGHQTTFGHNGLLKNFRYLYRQMHFSSSDFTKICFRLPRTPSDGAYRAVMSRPSAWVSNIRPAGHNPARHAFLSGPWGLPEMSKMIDLCLSGVFFTSSKICQNLVSTGAPPWPHWGSLWCSPRSPSPHSLPPRPLRHLDLAPDWFQICSLGPPVKKVGHPWSSGKLILIHSDFGDV